MKRRHLIGIGIIAAFFIFCVITYQSALTPYVNFSQAKATRGNVQVRGVLAVDTINQIDDGKSIQFRLRDENGEEAVVVYKGVKPDGLTQATSIVAIGQYQNGQFIADKLLVKCPSKYQKTQGSVDNS